MLVKDVTHRCNTVYIDFVDFAQFVQNLVSSQ